MLVLQWCKMQIICFMLLAYIGVNYIRSVNEFSGIIARGKSSKIFDFLFSISLIAVVFDGITACSVNFLDTVPTLVNQLLHLGMFVCYQLYVAFFFMYWYTKTHHSQSSRLKTVLQLTPLVISIIVTAALISELKFDLGTYTNYSMGLAVYSTFACIGLYVIMTVVIILMRRKYILSEERRGLRSTLFCTIIITGLQMIFPEFLVSGMAMAFVTISIYLTVENPTHDTLEYQHKEMVMGFATMVENRDDNTGSHIRRSSSYAVLIARNLRKNPNYSKIITQDFINDISDAAPLHDIGKIGIPDSILQKPDKLTAEEYEKMKEHPVIGCKIIDDTFGHLGFDHYFSMAREIALYHHEKWNGKGYPEGLQGTDIPLCARIMAVADVFDAVSAKRCYRDALPLSECYRIIKSGRGTDFDPDVVDAFFKDLSQVEEIFHNAK